MKKPKGKLAKVSGNNKNVDSLSLYNSWAKDYDNDLLNYYGYIAPKIIVNKFEKYFPNKKVDLIDVGCGTGLVGQLLKKKGYLTIDGIDLSEKMLNVAKKKNIYRSLFQLDLNVENLFPTKAYDALLCVGSFGHGALNKTTLNNLIELVKSKGMIFVFINSESYKSDSYFKYISSISRKGIWSILSINDYNYMSEINRAGKLIIAAKS